MTEREKMLSGQLYDPADSELAALRRRCRELAYDFNNTHPGNFARLERLMKELVPGLGEGSWLQQPVRFDYGCFISFGRECSANYNFTALDCAPITIGDHVLIGPNCIFATPVHPLHPEERCHTKRPDGSEYQPEYAKPITIESECWLASNVTVCGGVTIGRGSVIAAGSVVTRDIPPYSLAAGVPCRVIREITEDDRLIQASL